MRRVVVIGAGITGLAAAYDLNTLVASGALDGATVLEAGPRAGGKILTERADGFLVEGGPDSFLTVKPHALQLCREVGLGDRVVGTLPPRDVFVLHRGRLQPLPEGLTSMVPAPASLLRSPLFSWPEKVRFALDLFVPPSPDGADLSLGEFFGRRLGRAAVDRLVAPLLAGIYAGDPDHLSLQATFPQYADSVRRHGGLIRASRAGRRAGPAAPPDPGLFATLAGGLTELVDALAKSLTHVAVRTRTPVKTVTRGGRRYLVGLADGSSLPADAVIVTVPAPAAGHLLAGLNPNAAALMQQIPYASTAVVVAGFRRTDVAHPLVGHGYVVARSEGTLHTACTWVSSKWPGCAPPDHLVLRCYAGRAGDRRALTLDDGDLVNAVIAEVKPLLGVSGTAVFTRVYRWPDAMPQYLVGHRALVAGIEQALEATPGIAVAGAAYCGVGLPDCIREGRAAAARVAAWLRETVPA